MEELTVGIPITLCIAIVVGVVCAILQDDIYRIFAVAALIFLIVSYALGTGYIWLTE